MRNNALILDRESGAITFAGDEVGRLNFSEKSVLAHLINANGETCTKGELLASGWPGRYVVANSLNNAIKNIRAILRTTGLEHELVTIPKSGYKLTAGVIAMSEIALGENTSQPVESDLPEFPPTTYPPLEKEEQTQAEVLPSPSTAEINRAHPLVESQSDETRSTSHHSLPHTGIKWWKPSSLLYLLLLLLSCALYAFLQSHTPHVQCYFINETSYCGVEPLDTTQLPKTAKPGDQYIYGENYYDDQIQFYKIN